jgi:hypothetical protein
MGKQIIVKLYTIPQEACGPQQVSWNDVARMVDAQLSGSFPDVVDFEHVSFMDAVWFADSRAQELLENGNLNFPFVLVDGELVSAEKKVNISRLKKFIKQKISK